jgi:hypothetical protein
MRFSPGSAMSRSTCSCAKRQYSPICVASATCSSSLGTPQPIVAMRAVPVLILSTSYSGTPMSAKAIFAGASQTRSVTTSASPRPATRSIAWSMSSIERGSSAATRSGVKDLRNSIRCLPCSGGSASTSDGPPGFTPYSPITCSAAGHGGLICCSVFADEYVSESCRTAMTSSHRVTTQ